MIADEILPSLWNRTFKQISVCPLDWLLKIIGKLKACIGYEY